MSFLPLLIPLEGGGEGYHAPSVEDFKFDGGFFGPDWVNKPLVQALIAALLVIVVWIIASRKLKVVPSKGQFFWEYIYNFVRNGISRDIIGHDFRAYTPYLLGLFSFIWVNNIFGLFPAFMFPTMSNIGYAWALALLSWIVYNVAGIRKLGFGRYMKNSLIPDGVPLPLLFLVIPIEFLSNFIVRPLTLGLRLFGNMFAGHLVVMVFVVGGAYLLTAAHSSPFYRAAGLVSLIFSFAIFALELLVATLQAYIFTVLTAQYVSASTAEAH